MHASLSQIALFEALATRMGPLARLLGGAPRARKPDSDPIVST